MNDARIRHSNRTTGVASRAAAPANARRGNSLVLVSALLVLLVIIATAYLGRTRSERVLSTAQQQATLRDNRASAVADDLAREVAEALFVRPINKGLVPPVTPTGGVAADSNVPRLSIAPDAVRYGVDSRNTALPGAPAVVGYEYNNAPYHVVPFTNWPDGNPLYPRGPRNPTGARPLGEGNPVGNPGYNDARWLRDTEPVRIPIDPTLFGLNLADEVYVYSHWRKLSNIARAENGWRMVYDISNVLDSVVTNLSVPVEQWLRYPSPGSVAGNPFGNQPGQMWPNNSSAQFFTNFGTRQAVAINAFENQWNLWINAHPTTYQNVNFIPNNFYKLSDLFPSNAPNSFGERLEDEFHGPGTTVGGATGTARWSVSRTLADSDGDGYTDAFWFLAPTMIEGGLRQVVAVSIVDNAGLVNVNTATRFMRNDVDTNIVDSRTIGLTPADTALVAQNVLNNFTNPGDNWNAGFLDTFLNQSPANGFFFKGTQIRFRPEMWSTVQAGPPTREMNVLGALGVKGNLAFPNLLTTSLERTRYFRSLAARMDDPSENLTPFGIADEVELRMYRASNNAETLSRLERSFDARVYDPVGATFIGPGNQQVIFRSDDFLEESSDWFDRLSVPDLVRDNRWKTTTHSAVRNELMPPWMWPSPHPNDPQIRYDRTADNFVVDLPPVAEPQISQWRKLWNDRIRKVDLRFEGTTGVPVQFQINGYINAVSDALERALLTARPNPLTPNTVVGNSYYGDFAGGAFISNLENYRRTRKMIDSFAANIVAARDPDDLPLPVDFLLNTRPDVVGGDDFGRRRFPGMERHPFLVEAFVGHVYPIYTVPATYPNGGTRVIFNNEPGAGSADIATTIIAIQIANPFDQPLPLANLPETIINEEDLTPAFEVEIFGQTVPLRNLAQLVPPINRLPPCTDLEPRVLTLYAVISDYDGTSDFDDRWLDFLDVPGTLPDTGALPGAAGVNVNSIPGVTISLNRNTYDTHSGPAVQIVRVEQTGAVVNRLVVDRIDRLDDRQFGDAVNQMSGEIPTEGPTPLPPTDADFPIPGGWSVPSAIDGNQWVQWCRAVRSFGYGRDASRRNPRYVFSNRRIDVPIDYVGTGGNPATFFRSGNIYRVESDPDQPWFAQPRDHHEAVAAGVTTAVLRKPTTFNLRWNEQFYSAALGAPVSGDATVFYPDTGFYHVTFPMQMLQRNRDFDRVGDLGWVWLWGPELNIESPGDVFIESTFAEIMSREADGFPAVLIGSGTTTNRLRREIQTFGGEGDDVLSPSVNGVPLDPSIPALPAWARVYDAFTCDGAGLNPADLDNNGTISAFERESARMRLAAGYTGRPVHGLINVNTAPPEVLRAMPHMYRLIHTINSPSLNPRNRWADAIVAYRDSAGDWDPGAGTPIFPNLPPYGGRGQEDGGGPPDGYWPEIRPERGVAAIGELLIADAEPLDNTLSNLERASWRSTFAAREPFGGGFTPRISTDTFDRFQPDINNPSIGTIEADDVIGDVEEENLLLAGIANLVTTRSDTFTVYFRVRTFRQDPVSGRWDALKRENIVDDSRYVMVVDRSNVNSPSDRPRILFLEKMPD